MNMTSNSSKKGGRDDDQKGGQENFNDLQMQKFLLISTENPKELRWREEAGIPGLPLFSVAYSIVMA
jgi:hypothetical protein